jgi:geranylgeranyl diphosphate synthase type II
MLAIGRYKELFEAYLNKEVAVTEPRGLYEPVHYILNIGGKRLRPSLALWACDLSGTKPEEALPAALAVEIFHNFTLVHDDIMDHASIRRGMPTVHERWNDKTGILSGDVMMIMSYRFLEAYSGTVLERLLKRFNTTAIEVCEGQQMDMDFETRQDVSLEEYLKMIELKTSVLVGAAFEMGATVAGLSEKAVEPWYAFGKFLGMAFQLQDDFLDTFGKEDNFGKRIGGDIAENKKTYLYLKALEQAPPLERQRLRQLYGTDREEPDKVDQVTALFESCGVREHTLAEIHRFTEKAFVHLEKLPLERDEKNQLRQFGEELMKRTR